MKKPSATESLKESIRLLEIRQSEEGKIFKDQFRITYESLKPVNIIKSSIRELAHSVEVKTNLFESIMALVSGYLTKKIVVDSKSGFVMKLMRVLAHFGITNMVLNNSNEIRIYLSNLISRIFSPKDKVPETEI